MATPEDEVKTHLEAYRQSEAESNARAQARLNKMHADLDAVADKMKKEVLPVMERLRDQLLGQNLPAEASLLFDDRSQYAVAITLSCSNDIADASSHGRPYKYYASYLWKNGKLSYRTNRIDGRSVPMGKIAEETLHLTTLTGEDANTRLVRFVKDCFPVLPR